MQSAFPELWDSLSPGEGVVVDGQVSAKGNFKLSAQGEMSFSANGSAGEFSLALPDWPAPITSTQIKFGATTNSFALDIPSAKCGESKFSAKVSVVNFDNPVIDATISGEVPLAALNYMLPKSGSPELVGELTVDLSVSGAVNKPEQMKISGRARIKNGSYQAATLPENVESFEADIKIDTKQIDLKSFNVAFTSSDFSLRGSLSNPFPYFLPVSDSIKASSPAPHLKFVLESKRFSVDKLFPEAAPGSGVNRASMPADSAPPLFLPDMNGSGAVSFDTVVYADVEFINLSADVRIERRLIYVENIRGLAMEGSISGKALIDLSDFERPKYSGDFSGEGIEVEALLKRFSTGNGKGLLSGKINVKGSYECEGWEAEDFITSLTMDLNAIGDTVRVTEVPMISAFSNTLASLTKDDSYKDKFKVLTLSGFKSDLKFVAGRLQISELSGNSDKIGPWSLIGSIGVDGSLDMKGTIFPPHELIMAVVESNSLTKGFSEYLRDDTLSKFEIPLTITGALENPVVRLDMKIIEDIATRIVKNKLKKDGVGFLKDLFGGKKK
ncbi:MAG: hypothetical protein IIB00_00320 [candidate division Zixibacteria bacterium]|nr:hypothetical protein [candidate division Zixibacteria bacterium]